ncbi:zonadhesin-like [Crassostrea angulata]|uniref:zonadhesin-like n=1 Tax=Magallana angulata TaxID=2784310 RepID=UPI0022B1AA87|nr:zonadhesin-like [Crassostrea angulata]
MLPPKTCLLLVGLCLLFRYSVCDGPKLRTCTTDAGCAYLGDAFCDSTSPRYCKCDSGFYPYIGDTPVPDAGSTSLDVKCLDISVCRPGLNQCNSRGECYRYGEVFRCVCDYGYSGDNCEIDSFATTTPRMTITTKSPRRGIGNFVPFLAIPGVGIIIIIIIIIIIFFPMSTMGPVKTG